MLAAGPTDRGSGPPGSRVACRRTSVGFGRQRILARPMGPSLSTTPTSVIGMSKGGPVTYEELTPEHKQKFDEIKALFEADLIGSFERTRHHGIRWNRFSPEGGLDGVYLSLPSEERTRALCQEVNYMVAHYVHRHSESLVNAFERVTLRVIQEIMKNQYSPIGPTLGVIRGDCHFKLGHHCLMRSQLQNHTVHQHMSYTRWGWPWRLPVFQRAA
jgi:hypothetical protein